MTLQIPTVSDPEVQRALDVIAMAFPVRGGNIAVRQSFGAVAGTTGAVLTAGSADWAATRTGLGQYTVTFTPAFRSVPVVALTSHQATAGAAYNLEINTAAANAVTIFIRQPGVVFIDNSFDFIAVGT